MRAIVYGLNNGYWHRACSHSVAALERVTALQAVTEAITVLEDEECLNAGEVSRSSLARVQAKVLS